MLEKIQKHALWLAPLLGLLAPLAFPPFDYKPLAPLALAALCALVARTTTLRSLLIGWLFGLAYFASGIYWLFISTHIYGGAPAPLALLLCGFLFSYMAFYPALVAAGFARLRLHDSGWGYLALPALWLLAELLRGWIWSGFPWLSFGYIALDTPLQRYAPLVGAYGISALVALIAYAGYRAVVSRGRARAIAFAVLLAPLAASHMLPPAGAWTVDAGAPLTAAIVQANIEQDQKWLPEMQRPTLRFYDEATRAALDSNVIVWSEVALAQPYDAAQPLLDPLGEELRGHDATLVFGTLIEREQHYYNSVLAIGAGPDTDTRRYDKHHLVPFGEYFPIPDFLRPLMDVLGKRYTDLLAGAPTQPPLTVHGQPISVSICFEDVFPNEFRRAAQRATLLINVTNDAWFGRSGAAAQHLQMARMRSLETGRATLRASNTGVSAVIGPDGRIAAHAGFFTREILRASVTPRRGLTPYMRWGDVPLWWLAPLVIVFSAWRVRRVTKGLLTLI